MRLRRRIPFAWHRARFDLPIFDGPHGCAVHAIEHEQVRPLRYLRDGADRFAVHSDVDEIRRRREVVVPDVVVHELLMPHAFARSRVEADEAAGEQVVAGSVAAVKVARRRFDRQVEVAELFVSGKWRPHGRVAGVRPGIVQPGVVAELAGLRNRVKRPEPLARADVEAANITLRVFLRARRRAADHGRTEDDHVADDNGGRCRADDAIARWWLIEILIQIDDAVAAERRIREARLCIK